MRLVMEICEFVFQHQLYLFALTRTEHPVAVNYFVHHFLMLAGEFMYILYIM